METNNNRTSVLLYYLFPSNVSITWRLIDVDILTAHFCNYDAIVPSPINFHWFHLWLLTEYSHPLCHVNQFSFSRMIHDGFISCKGSNRKSLSISNFYLSTTHVTSPTKKTWGEKSILQCWWKPAEGTRWVLYTLLGVNAENWRVTEALHGEPQTA